MGAEVETIRIEGSLLADLYARHAEEALRLSYLLTGNGLFVRWLPRPPFMGRREHHDRFEPRASWVPRPFVGRSTDRTRAWTTSRPPSRTWPRSG